MRKRFAVLVTTTLLLTTALVVISAPAGGAPGGNHHMRWDIPEFSGGPSSIVISPGGKASAFAEGDNKITLTGTGTFRSNPGKSQSVTGGGTWATSGSIVGTDSGTYEVTGFVSFVLAPGGLPSPPFVDGITGVLADARAGLLVLEVAYSDGSEGVLVLSCHLVGSPDSIFEGITASKGFVDFWNRVAPTGAPPFGPNENRTLFHVLP